MLALGSDSSTVAHIKDVNIIVDDKDDDCTRSCLVMRLVGRWRCDFKEVFLGLVAAFPDGCLDV